MPYRNATSLLSIIGFLCAGLFAQIAIAQTTTETSAILRASPVKPEPDAPITALRTRAHKLFRAITGVPLPIDDPRLKQMEALLNDGKEKEAAKIATADALFYDVRVRDMARKMSTREESVRAPLTDFVATFVGVVRDSDTVNAKELLTGNFIYRADTSLTMINGKQKVRSDELNDIVASNNHYSDIENNNFSLYAVLKKQDGQVTVSSAAQNTVIPNPDPAGLITTRGFTEAHAVAGTNRRMLEFTFREFMCAPITEWSDADSPDDRVGRDVDRYPGGTNNKYQTACKACHGNMDGLRGAFAKIDFTNNRLAYQATGVNGKMSRNSNEFPNGFITVDDSFVNYANVGKNADQFGWRSALTGNGMKQLGQMLANSQGFSRCMVRRVFMNVCRRDPLSSEEALIRRLADDFETGGYHMRGLFEMVALRPECISRN